MHESYFQFEKPPFRVVPDPNMLYASTAVQEAMSRLEFAVRTGKGIVVMSGEVGTGKTTLINRFLDRVGPDTQTAYVFNPTLSGLQLLRTLADELGVQTQGMAKVDLTRVLYEFLLRSRKAGKRTILFVDEAQSLSREALEELRLLSNLETWQEKLLHIILVGQPELLDKLEAFQLRQLRQRVELFIQIEPMSPAETQQYIEHRLRLANPRRSIVFTDSACRRIHRIANGIPRTINIVCDAALVLAYVAETATVTSRMVGEATRTIDAQQVSLHPGRSQPARFWQRVGTSAAALAAVLTLFLIYDSTARRGGRPGATGGSREAVTQARSEIQAAEPTQTPVPSGRAILVHLASYRSLEHAYAHAKRLPPEIGPSLYLQTVEASGQTWHRVLLGDFLDLKRATEYAREAERSGALPYARAVEVSQAGLEALEGSGFEPRTTRSNGDSSLETSFR